MHVDRHDQATDVREWLSEAGPGADAWPSSFGAGEAIRQAHVRRRRHRFATVGTATAAVLALLAVPAVTGWPWSHTAEPGSGVADRATSTQPARVTVTNCTIADLPVPDGLAARGVTQPSRVFVTAMDPTGAYVTANAFAADNTAAAVILWHNRVATVLPTGGLGTIATTIAVNSHGVVAGTGEAPGAVGFAWVYRNGAATRLPNVPGYDRLVQVFAVNEAGDVLGSALSASGEHSIVVVWPAAAPHQPQIQEGLTDKLGTGIGAAFADNGQIYAWSQAATTPTVWTRDGRQHALALPDGYTAGAVSGVHGSWAFGDAFKQLPPSRTITRGPVPSIDAPVPVRWKLDGGSGVTVIVGAAMDSMDTLTPAFATTQVTTNGAPTLGYVTLGGTAPARVFVLPANGGAAFPIAISNDGSLVAGSAGPAGSLGYAGDTRPVLWHC